MAFVKKPVTGMRDILPAEMEIRTGLQQIIRDTYRRYGFTEIETPVMEHIGNLTSKQGGDNEKLIFKVLKRGDKLGKALEGQVSADELCEEGLRYDLTVPLSRYYASNQAQLPSPFKALQMGNVFRADRPQRGRFRQFMQCDIDIFGDATNLAEKELILATTEALERMGMGRFGFSVVINDRRLLTEMISWAGFPAEEAGNILIILDKADKIGAEGVDAELAAAGYDDAAIRRMRGLFAGLTPDAEGAKRFAGSIGTQAAEAAGQNIAEIMETCAALEGRTIRIAFDPTLVRGMGYYTGTIFELKLDNFGSSVGGGGRYDRMVGNFTGQDVPAVGFSIGFERIMSLLMEQDTSGILPERERSAWLIEKGMPAGRLSAIFSEAVAERAKGREVWLGWMAKNRKFQKESLGKDGYKEFREFYVEELRK